MRQLVNKTKKTFLPVILAAVMVIAMAVPAFAASGDVSTTAPTVDSSLKTASIYQSPDTTTALTTVNMAQGTDTTFTANDSQYVAGSTHFEWYSSNSSVVSINRKSGMAVVDSGATTGSTATITVYLVNYASAKSGGSGSGPWYPDAADVLAYQTCTVTVTAGTAYGWQGSDLHMMVTDPSGITINNNFTTSSQFVNTVSSPIAVSSTFSYLPYGSTEATTVNNAYKFTYQFNAGFNSSHGTWAFIHTYKGYNNLDEVHVYEYNSGTLVGTEIDDAEIVGGNAIGFSGNVSTFELGITGLASNQTYVLEFGKDICNYMYNQNNNRTLGTPVYIIFTTANTSN